MIYDDLRCDEQAHATQVGTGGMNHLRPDDALAFRLQNSLLATPFTFPCSWEILQ